MSVTADDLKTALSVGAILISLVSLYFTKVNWLQSNRPVVTAFITEHSSGISAATFNLVIANTGSRPAVRVRLHASEAEIASLLEPGVRDQKFKMIESNFLSASEIPLLRNGEELTTSFGAFTDNPGEDSWLRYGSEAEVSITYKDLEGRKFESRFPIKVYAREGFGGGVWAAAKA
ncbi:MAG: hypothetical protein IPH26_00215 [Sterolibacteriaceae bacterium]|uniref:Uncharacterized protein n=1 Tax=Candidatus Methylophosphatis roskildensis TaxID=2899263 RepID=A0A9D7E059_9PROT|nr:hypothetical protein [Candidatus Methylophosphatis roskildensis]MBK7234493.1 hypothetical protein [Sterolibacteriaceae bacterium]